MSRQNIKSKLEELISELNNNLPEIDFEDSEREESESKIELNEKDRLNLAKKDEETDVEFHKLNLFLNNNNLGQELEDYDYDNNEIIPCREFDELNDLRLSFSATSINHYNDLNTDAISTAEQITKNIFNGKNSKLSMDKFNSINIDEALNSLNHKNTSEPHPSKWYSSLIKNSSSSAIDYPTILNNDEKILKKLAEMSMQISKGSDLKNLDTKKDILTNNTSTTSLRNVNFAIFEELTNGKKLNSNAFDLIETQISDDIFNKDLEKFLQSHNIKDGNMVETRRIDLRANQHQNNQKQPDPKNVIKTLFNQIVIDEKKDLKPKFKFINQNESSSEDSSSCDEEEENNQSLLWIDRYRKQKLKLPNKNNN